MLKREQQAYTIHQVNLHNKVPSNSLSTGKEVSKDTIPRDLPELSENRKLSLSFNDLSYPTKKIIANKVIDILITGLPSDHPSLQPFAAAGITVM